jgi:hypothetical protein
LRSGLSVLVLEMAIHRQPAGRFAEWSDRMGKPSGPTFRMQLFVCRAARGLCDDMVFTLSMDRDSPT